MIACPKCGSSDDLCVWDEEVTYQRYSATVREGVDDRVRTNTLVVAVSEGSDKSGDVDTQSRLFHCNACDYETENSAEFGIEEVEDV